MLQTLSSMLNPQRLDTQQYFPETTAHIEEGPTHSEQTYL